jgi:hypothetical protein
MGLIYSYFYLLFTTLTPVFETNYGFSTSIVGLSYLGVGFGFLIGQVSYARLGDEILRRMTRKSGSSEMKPEYRLPLSIVGGALVPVGLFWYGWSVEGGVHWIMAVIGTGVIGIGNCLIFVGSLLSESCGGEGVLIYECRSVFSRIPWTRSNFTRLLLLRPIRWYALSWRLYCRSLRLRCIKLSVWGGGTRSWRFWRWPWSQSRYY